MGKAHSTPVFDRMADKFTVGDDCWEWTGAKARAGYGYITLGRQGDGIGRAHRLLPRVLKTHCPEGHAYTAENVYDYGHGRMCRICQTTRMRARYQARRREEH